MTLSPSRKERDSTAPIKRYAHTQSGLHPSTVQRPHGQLSGGEWPGGDLSLTK